MWLDIIKDTFFDSIKMLPFLFAAYLLIEYVEHRHSEAMEKILSGGGKMGFLSGALLGLLPQCGFSAMAANLYSSRVITAGTLVAVFLSTSDEAIPILIADPHLWDTMLKLILIKFAAASVFGFLIDNVLKKMLPGSAEGGYRGNIREIDCHEHIESEGVLKAALRHTLHIFSFIVAFVFILNAVMSFAGTERLAGFIRSSGMFQIFAAGLVGMIPNCAASVLLTQLYAAGQLSFSGLLSGLCTGAGIGPLVLIRTCRDKKEAAGILLLLYITGTIIGLLAFFLGL